MKCREVPDFLGGQQVTATNASGRSELAGWLTDPSNPLTARVMANRLWQWHFGRGLVKTANDFGSRGDRRRIPRCSTIWPANSSRAAGASRRSID